MSVTLHLTCDKCGVTDIGKKAKNTFIQVPFGVAAVSETKAAEFKQFCSYKCAGEYGVTQFQGLLAFNGGAS